MRTFLQMSFFWKDCDSQSCGKVEKDSRAVLMVVSSRTLRHLNQNVLLWDTILRLPGTSSLFCFSFNSWVSLFSWPLLLLACPDVLRECRFSFAS